MKRVWIIAVVAVLVGMVPIKVGAADLQTGGKSALLMDVATGTVLYESNPHEKLAPASVTKVMTMLLIMEAIDSGKINWSDAVTASAEAAAKGGSQVYLKEGENMTVEEMLKSIAVSSANDCACAMAEYLAGSEAAFVEQMNTRAAELGMTDTHFVNCTGLDDAPEAAKHRTCAHDIALMSRELMRNHPDIKRFTTIWMDSVRGGTFGLSNTNKMIRFYHGATGLKTGFTSGAGYCLSATAQREGMELIAVVMGAESSRERFNTCKTMLDHGFASYSLIQPELADGPADIPVRLGKRETVSARLEGPEQMLIDKAQRQSVSMQVQLEECVTAPVSRGQRLGTMTVKAGEQVLAQIPLVAAEAVERQGFWDLFVKVFRRAAMAS